MQVYKLTIYSQDILPIYSDTFSCDDRQAAELMAEMISDSFVDRGYPDNLYDLKKIR